MREQIKKHTVLAGALFTVLVGIVVIFACTSGRNTNKKETVVIGNASWISHTFESASEQAITIVYGEVVGKGEMQGNRASEYQTEVTIDVIEWVKGDMESDKIIFREMGGETKTKIYTVEGVTPVQIGEKYVFFLNQYGAFLNPRTLIPVVDGEISMTKALSPETTTFTNISTADTIPVNEYLEAIRNIFS